MTRRRLLLIISVLIAILVTASLAVLYKKGFLTPKNQLPSKSPSILWKTRIERAVTDFVVADGKIFVRDNYSYIFCFDAESGEPIWENRLGAPRGRLQWYEGKLYAASTYSFVNRIEANTGTPELQFEVPSSPDTKYKANPKFFVADGRIFVSFYGEAIYNASTGDLFWQSGDELDILASASPSESNIVYMSGMSRIDPNNGSRIWKVPGDAGDYPIVAGERVIFWNYKPTDTDWRIGPVILCVDVSSGEELWSFDVGGPIFHPTVSNGLVLFGAEDGFFYALNLTDSTLEWKTYVDLLALMVSHNRHLPKLAGYGPTVSLPMVDSKNQIIYWNMMGTSRRQDKYKGAIYSLNLTNGDIIWITPFWNTIDPYNYQETSNAISSPDLSSDSKIETISITTIAKSNTYGEFNMALLNNKLYLSAHQELRCFDASTGSFQWNESYNERANVLWPIEAYNKVYMIADGYLRAYG